MLIDEFGAVFLILRIELGKQAVAQAMQGAEAEVVNVRIGHLIRAESSCSCSCQHSVGPVDEPELQFSGGFAGERRDQNPIRWSTADEEFEEDPPNQVLRLARAWARQNLQNAVIIPDHHDLALWSAAIKGDMVGAPLRHYLVNKV